MQICPKQWRAALQCWSHAAQLVALVPLPFTQQGLSKLIRQLKDQVRKTHTCDGTCTILLGPGCQATMAICFCIVCTSGGSSGFVRYENETTPSASSFSCFVQSCRSAVTCYTDVVCKAGGEQAANHWSKEDPCSVCSS